MDIKALVFDVYGTLFNVHSVKEKADELYPMKGDEISRQWRQKQLEYSFLRQLMGKYETFWKITEDSLRYTLKNLKLEHSSEKINALMDAYLHLSPYPEVEEVLTKLRSKRLAVFSNGSHKMLDPLIKHSGLSSLFNEIISVDDRKQYKPTPAAYHYVLDRLELERSEILFMSSNGWDISGARAFGFQTAWINRNQFPVEELGLRPHSIFPDLYGILTQV
ncbi:haloacid dehalogenase type II [Neobacillus sp. SM06]|uniref:haloacid dehalogenase type II n=1 Tax=Neobacillus sp. SM06 TaxID=3422492 RepID=UPI003D27B384